MSVEDKIHRKTVKTLNFPLPNLSTEKNINYERLCYYGGLEELNKPNTEN